MFTRHSSVTCKPTTCVSALIADHTHTHTHAACYEFECHRCIPMPHDAHTRREVPRSAAQHARPFDTRRMINPLSLVAPACGLVALAHWHPGVPHRHEQEAAVQARRCPTPIRLAVATIVASIPTPTRTPTRGRGRATRDRSTVVVPVRVAWRHECKVHANACAEKEGGAAAERTHVCDPMPYPLPQGLPALHDQSSLRLQPCTRARVLRLCHRHRLLRCYRDIIYTRRRWSAAWLSL